MFPSVRLGSLFGFPIRANLSFFLLLFVFFLSMPGYAGLGIILMAAGSVLLHELGHALMARRLGLQIAGIELHFFGGAAQMTDLPRRPNDEIAVALAGPAVSLALGGIGVGLSALSYSTFMAEMLSTFGIINLGLAVFNMLPVFPSDGGRVLRAWLARRRGLVAATDLAVKVGRVLAAGMVVYGLATGSFMLVAVAVVLGLMGGAERLAARMRGDRGAWSGRGDGGGWGWAPQRPREVVDVEYIPPRAPRRPVVFVWRG